MKTKTMLTIDWWAFPLYASIRWWQNLTSQKQTSASVSQAIIIKMMGIGSITRIFETLRKNKVDFDNIHFLTFKSNEELCELLEIPNVYYIPDSSVMGFIRGCRQQIKRLRLVGVNGVVDFERSSNLLGLFRFLISRSTNTVTVSFYNLKADDRKGCHYRYNLNGRSMNDLITLSLDYLPKSKTGIKESEKPYTTGDNILVNINASDYLPHRKFSVQGFAKVIEGILSHYPQIKVQLIGANNEQPYVQSFKNRYFKSVPNVVNQCGQWNLTELTYQLASARLLITNDSGPMHLAVKLKVKTVVIWGPTSSAIYGYIDNPNVINIESDYQCRPCFVHPKSKTAVYCNGNIDCMKTIDPMAIIEAAMLLLNEETLSA